MPRLMEDLLGKGYHVYVDNCYTSKVLSTYLYEHNTAACGSARKSRRVSIGTGSMNTCRSFTSLTRRKHMTYLLFTRPMLLTEDTVTVKAMLSESSN